MSARTVLSRMLHWWPTGLTLCVILYATLSSDPLPPNSLPSLPDVDKLIHAIMFGGLAGAMAFDYSRLYGTSRLSRSTMLLFCLLSAAVGGGIELAQAAMGLGRSADVLDFAADALGCAVAAFAAPPAIRRVINRR